MRRISLIAWIALPTAAAVALSVAPSCAEAGEFGLRLGVGAAAAATSMPVMSRAVLPIAVALPLSPPVTALGDRPPVVRRSPAVVQGRVGVAPAPEGVKPLPPARVASAWCPSDRIAGDGTGFCEIN